MLQMPEHVRGFELEPVSFSVQRSPPASPSGTQANTRVSHRQAPVSASPPTKRPRAVPARTSVPRVRAQPEQCRAHDGGHRGAGRDGPHSLSLEFDPLFRNIRLIAYSFTRLFDRYASSASYKPVTRSQLVVENQAEPEVREQREA